MDLMGFLRQKSVGFWDVLPDQWPFKGFVVSDAMGGPLTNQIRKRSQDAALRSDQCWRNMENGDRKN